MPLHGHPQRWVPAHTSPHKRSLRHAWWAGHMPALMPAGSSASLFPPTNVTRHPPSSDVHPVVPGFQVTRRKFRWQARHNAPRLLPQAARTASLRLAKKPVLDRGRSAHVTCECVPQAVLNADRVRVQYRYCSNCAQTRLAPARYWQTGGAESSSPSSAFTHAS